MIIGLVRSRFNEEITQKLKEGALRVLEAAGCQVRVAEVPGAVEIPIMAQKLLLDGCEGVIACGAVIRGETDHYDMVCDSVNQGLTQVALQLRKPIAHAVLACHDEEQAWARLGGEHGHKGEDAARVIMEMVQKLQRTD